MKRNRSAVNPGEIANDRETEAGSLHRFGSSNAALHDGVSHRRLYSRAVVINRNHDRFTFFRPGEPDLGASPLAGIVEKVAEHLVEIFSLSPEGMRRGPIDLDADTSFGMQPLKRAGKSFGRCGDRRARRRRRGGGGRSRVRQVKVDLPPHALDLLIDLRGKLPMSCRARLLRLVRQHCQWRLQAMREVAGLCDGARDAPLALVEQRVEVVDQSSQPDDPVLKP